MREIVRQKTVQVQGRNSWRRGTLIWSEKFVGKVGMRKATLVEELLICGIQQRDRSESMCSMVNGSVIALEISSDWGQERVREEDRVGLDGEEFAKVLWLGVWI